MSFAPGVHDPYTIQIIELVLYSIALVRAKKERGL